MRISQGTSKRNDGYFVRGSMRRYRFKVLSFAHKSTKELLATMLVNWRLTMDKGSSTDDLWGWVRSKARAIWIWPQERKFFFTRSEDILYSKEKNIHKSNHNDIFGTFLVKFYCFWRVEQILSVSRCSPHRPPSWFFGWIQNMGEELMPLYSAPSCLNRQNNYFAFSQLTRDN